VLLVLALLPLLTLLAGHRRLRDGDAAGTERGRENELLHLFSPMICRWAANRRTGGCSIQTGRDTLLLRHVQ
jgi:hypothetical protein